MRTYRGIVAAAAFALCSSATPILAADIIEAPPEPVIDWTALHIGIGVGGQILLADVDAYINAAWFEDFWWNTGIFAEAWNDSDLGKAGLFGTVEAGYDFQLGSNVVIGILANFDFGNVKAKSHSDIDIEIGENEDLEAETFGHSQVSVKLDDSWAIGARLGMLSSESTLIYVLGGYTQARLKAKIDLYANAWSDAIGDWFEVWADHSDKDWVSGFFVGGGIETLLSEHLSLKAEYRYANYKNLSFDEHFDNNCDDDCYFTNADVEIDPVIHSVRAVLSWRF